ncbi:hypothetical protein L873DRAFT_1827270 [Choiromyces venosus 120613-1]|uniref:PAS domain-containing protein n=1 Tax=Choiromyces venosus 120613-1 TaxID=1336337 RepID=A0A3N4JVV0_9PEZI|nr:hypothetical protein L873DRAFT_1827270 [Choiromyces venosus 120613-1]
MAGAVTSGGAQKKPPRNKKSTVSPPTPRCDHALQFYEAESYLYSAISSFILPTFFSTESASVIIATRSHLDALEVHLREQNLVPGQLKDRGQLVLLDADEILLAIMPGGSLDVDLFDEYLGKLFPGVQSKFPKVRAYGELVNILCEQGNYELARQVEVAWERFLSEPDRNVALLCGYNMGVFEAEGLSEVFQQICLNHSKVEPTEKEYPTLGHSNNQKTAVAMLQQKTRCLEAEINRRKMSEAAFQMILDHFSSSSRSLDKSYEADGGYTAHPTGICGRILHEGRIRYFANDRFCQISGLAEATIRRDGNWLNAVHHFDREKVSRCFSFEDGRMRKVEYRFVHSNGDVRWVSAEFTVGLSGYTHSVVDITDIKEATSQRQKRSDNCAEMCSSHHSDRRTVQNFTGEGQQRPIPDSVLRWDRGHSNNHSPNKNSLFLDTNQKASVEHAQVEVEKISKIFSRITEEESALQNSINFVAVSKTMDELRVWHSSLPGGFTIPAVINDHSLHPAFRSRLLLGHCTYFRSILAVTRRILVRVATRAAKSAYPDDPSSLEVHYSNKCIGAARAICRVHDLLASEDMAPAQKSWLTISSYFIACLIVFLDTSLNPPETPADDLKLIIPRCMDTIRNSANTNPCSKRYIETLDPLWIALKPPVPHGRSSPRPPSITPPEDWANLGVTPNWTQGRGTTITNDILDILISPWVSEDAEWAATGHDWRFLVPQLNQPHNSPHSSIHMSNSSSCTPPEYTSWSDRSSDTRRAKRSKADDECVYERSSTPLSGHSRHSAERGGEMYRRR